MQKVRSHEHPVPESEGGAVSGVKLSPPEIPNPVKLAFRVAEVAWRELGIITDAGGRELPAIPLHQIFADDLERTLWLAIKFRHLTSQMFNHEIRAAASIIRAYPPADPTELHHRIESMTGRHTDDLRPRDHFCEELFRYVLNVLDGGSLKLEYVEPAKPAPCLSENK